MSIFAVASLKEYSYDGRTLPNSLYFREAYGKYSMQKKHRDTRGTPNSAIHPPRLFSHHDEPPFSR